MSHHDNMIISKSDDEFIPMLPTHEELTACRTGIAMQINASKEPCERDKLKMVLWDIDFLIGML